ncbi:MAG: VOC family protein, partial [Bacteroidota bacterium]
MQAISRLMTNICSTKIQESKDFYTALFDFDISFESDWFVQLISKNKQLEFGIIDRANEIVPKDAQSNPKGFYITFVVDNTDDVFDK